MKNNLEKSNEGLFVLASFYMKIAKYGKSYRILEKLAAEDNRKAILILALQKKSARRYMPENYTDYKKYFDYIINSKNEKNISDLYEKIYSYSYQYKYKKELLEYEKLNLNSKDILVLRNIVTKTKSYKHKMLALNKLVEYKDVKAIKALLRSYNRTNKEKALALMQILIALEDKITMFNLATYYKRTSNQELKTKSLNYFTKLANDNHLKSIEYLSKYYSKSRDKSKENYKKALYWSEVLAKKNDKYYIKRMVFLYKNAKDEMKNEEKEKYWKLKLQN
ncbi:MAG: hypothetical protein HRT40_13845 [Campylobacteraceae bacterium]|nr:hypothetical protein [Campylobacteraceae bacterium]